MKYFELETKGIRIVGEDKNSTLETLNLLHQLIDSFYEANAALNLYIKHDDALFEGLSSPPPYPPTDEEWAKEVEERKMLASEVIEEFGIPPDDWHEINHQVEIISKRKKWSQGSVPRQIELAEHEIFAKAFIYAFDTIVETLKNLKSPEGVPEMVAKKLEEIENVFPDLKGIRDTAHHMGDRIILKGRHGKRIETDGGNVILNNHGDGIFSTLLDGKYKGTQGSIAITYDSLEKMGKIVQDVLDYFQWEGLREHLPR